MTNTIIASAEEKFTKTLFTNASGGDKPVLFSARNESGEAQFIVDSIGRLLDEGADISNIAVLFRSGYHSYKLEMELTSRYIYFE